MPKAVDVVQLPQHREPFWTYLINGSGTSADRRVVMLQNFSLKSIRFLLIAFLLV
ncbi:hypothetical protein Hanom_Chr12g01099051 [Helianthus anomalus]